MVRVAVGVLVLAALALPIAAGRTNHVFFLGDFHGDLYIAGQKIIAGLNPYYGDTYVAHLAAVARTGGHPQTAFAVPVYPAPALVAFAPLSLLPWPIAGSLYLGISIVSVLIALRLLDVRDFRCVAAAVLCAPMLVALIDGTLDPLLLLGAAAAWRWRANVWRAAAAVASLVALKLLAWPLIVWMAITRRFRAAALTVLLSAGALLLGWAVIDFAGMAQYPRLLSDLGRVEEGVGVSLVGGLHAAGLGLGTAQLVSYAAAAALLALAWALRHEPGHDRRAFGLAVLAAITASPIVWMHYVVLLFVPIALLSPSFSVLWLVPLLGYVAPETASHGDLLLIAPYLLIEAIVVLWLCLRSSPGLARFRGWTSRRSASAENVYL